MEPEWCQFCGRPATVDIDGDGENELCQMHALEAMGEYE